MIRQTILALCFAFAGTAQLVAQPDPDAEPQGSAYLSAGFTPDPFLVELQGGGRFDAAGLGAYCAGHVGQAPDFGLYYNSGDFPLIVSVASQDDTTLAIKAPDGAWACDDDGGEGFNPLGPFRPAAIGTLRHLDRYIAGSRADTGPAGGFGTL